MKVKHQNSCLASKHLFFVFSSSLGCSFLSLWSRGPMMAFPMTASKFSAWFTALSARRVRVQVKVHLGFRAAAQNLCLLLCCSRAIVNTTLLHILRLWEQVAQSHSWLLQSCWWGSFPSEPAAWTSPPLLVPPRQHWATCQRAGRGEEHSLSLDTFILSCLHFLATGSIIFA